ncbi:DUF2061 domain-containing protein [Haladaptatus pallidirubidus]|uniref:DUF2061 domain-containing protein n=1 Tax=Haladaptatus pallidirubidus TaxID=1008152 RepID=UPI00223941DD|nr:DUF2061 domain-containing protein [Haladaptatus pallidirubidus]
MLVGNINEALNIGIAISAVKTIIYYVYERAWITSLSACRRRKGSKSGQKGKVNRFISRRDQSLTHYTINDLNKFCTK